METGREQAFTRMVEAYQPALLKMCFVILRDRGLAEDAVQETFIKAYRAMDSFRQECGEKTWLTRIAVNTCRDIRRLHWFRLVDLKAALEDIPMPPVPFEEEDERLTLAIMNLPLKEKEPLMLYYYQDMSMADIADTLHISVSTVSNRLKRARTRLHNVLEGGDRHA